jgi:hypothetical protein
VRQVLRRRKNNTRNTKGPPIFRPARSGRSVRTNFGLIRKLNSRRQSRNGRARGKKRPLLDSTCSAAAGSCPTMSTSVRQRAGKAGAAGAWPDCPFLAAILYYIEMRVYSQRAVAVLYATRRADKYLSSSRQLAVGVHAKLKNGSAIWCQYTPLRLRCTHHGNFGRWQPSGWFSLSKWIRLLSNLILWIMFHATLKSARIYIHIWNWKVYVDLKLLLK